MPHDLKTLIPPIDEAGRAKRIQVEHKLLDRLLKDLDNPELDQADLRNTMRDYCELKKQDNLHEKIIAQLAIADARLALAEARHALAEARLNRPLPLPVRERAGVRVTTANPGGAQSAFDDAEPEPYDSDNSPSDLDPDPDPEWSLAPWGRRRNGKPRTEKEFRTILHRTVLDVYGLSLSESTERPTPQRTAEVPPTPTERAPAPTPDTHHQPNGGKLPASDTPHPASHIPSPRSPPGRCGEPSFVEVIDQDRGGRGGLPRCVFLDHKGAGEPICETGAVAPAGRAPGPSFGYNHRWKRSLTCPLASASHRQKPDKILRS